jgi:hypothetical protein
MSWWWLIPFGCGFVAAGLVSGAVGLWLLRRADRLAEEEAAEMAEAGTLRPEGRR